MVGRLLFGLLVLVSALVGATAGLLLVYSTDLPQVDQLEHYRPSSITELYDDQGRIIGSFALQRRVVASYEDYPQVLRDALISIEDKDFYRHWGINVWRIAGAAYRDIVSGGKVQGASTLTMQLARNLFLSPDRIVPSQDSGSAAGHPDRAPLHQAADFYLVRQPDLSRSWRLRIRSGLPVLLQQACETAHPGRSRAACGFAQVTGLLFADHSS